MNIFYFSIFRKKLESKTLLHIPLPPPVTTTTRSLAENNSPGSLIRLSAREKSIVAEPMIALLSITKMAGYGGEEQVGLLFDADKNHRFRTLFIHTSRHPIIPQRGNWCPC